MFSNIFILPAVWLQDHSAPCKTVCQETIFYWIWTQTECYQYIIDSVYKDKYDKNAHE